MPLEWTICRCTQNQQETLILSLTIVIDYLKLYYPNNDNGQK